MAEMTLKERLDHARKYGIPKAPKAQVEATRPSAQVIALPGGIGLGLAKADRTLACEIDEAMKAKAELDAQLQKERERRERWRVQDELDRARKEREREECKTVIDGVEYFPVTPEPPAYEYRPPWEAVRKYNVRYNGYDPFRDDPWKVKPREDWE